MNLSIQRSVGAKPLQIALGVLALGFGSVHTAMAGIVEGHTAYDDLILTGSQQDDQIEIVQLSNGTIRVRGRNGTTIRQTGSNGSGSTSVDFTFSNGVRDITINLHAGNDRLIMGELQNGTASSTQPIAVEMLGALEIHLEEGSDTVLLNALEVFGNANITTGFDYDTVYVNNSLFHGNFGLDLGRGSDYTRMQFTEINGNATVHAIGVGTDGTTRDYNGYDQDIIEWYEVTVGGDLGVWTGNGVDGITFTELMVTGKITLNTGDNEDERDNRDFISLDKLVAMELNAQLGAGDDAMEISNSTIGIVRTNGGRGRDRLYLLGNTIEEIYGAHEGGSYEYVYED